MIAHRYVAVVGSGEAAPELADLAEEVGSRLGDAGVVVVCGGLGGVMEAACRGARRSGATTVGILPGFDRRAANPWVEVAVATGLGEARNALVAQSADAVIAIGGEYGTLSEVALALRARRPVIGLGTWQLHRPGGGLDPGVIGAVSPEDAVARALAAIEELAPGTGEGDGDELP